MSSFFWEGVTCWALAYARTIYPKSKKSRCFCDGCCHDLKLQVVDPIAVTLAKAKRNCTANCHHQLLLWVLARDTFFSITDQGTVKTSKTAKTRCHCYIFSSWYWTYLLYIRSPPLSLQSFVSHPKALTINYEFNLWVEGTAIIQQRILVQIVLSVWGQLIIPLNDLKNCQRHRHDLSVWRSVLGCPCKTKNEVKPLTQSAEKWICMGKWPDQIGGFYFSGFWKLI